MYSQGNAVEPAELMFEEGVFLVKIARKAIETYVTENTVIEPLSETLEKLKRPGMAFVTIERYSRGRELRGCIGFLQPVSPLVKTVINAAIAAATEDPRFLPLTKEELDDIVVEVSILSIPKLVKNVDEIIVGKHGLLIYRGWRSGTLLPQVPIEYCWDRETFLAECCLKAGLDPDCWLDTRTRIYVYEARIFYEKTPRGEIVERDLNKEFRERCGD
jgi:uncharacterized protein (TIGR00296 family)